MSTKAVKLDETIDTPVEPIGLYRKLVLIMGEIDRVQKKGKNTGLKYDFVQEADVVELVRESFVTHGVLIFPHKIEHLDVSDIAKTETDSKGASRTTVSKLTTMKITFKVIDSETGQFDFIETIGQGWDTTDKGAYKAMTGANKYALLKGLLLPTGDDPEKDDKDAGTSTITTTATTNKKTDSSSGQPPPVDPYAVMENMLGLAVQVGQYNEEQLRGLIKQESKVTLPRNRTDTFDVDSMRRVYAALKNYVDSRNSDAFIAELKKVG